MENTILLIFLIFGIVIISLTVIFTVKRIKEVKDILRKDRENLNSRDTIEEHNFTIVDILDIDDKDIDTYILIKDDNSKSLYVYLSNVDCYKWKDDEGYLEPQYIISSKEVYLYNDSNEDAFPLEFNDTGGRYKLVEEQGRFEIHDDKLYIYKKYKSKPSIIRLNKIIHANNSYDLNNIHNVILIDCFIIYDKHSNEKIY